MLGYAWTLDVGPESITNGLRQGGSPKRAEGEAILDKGRFVLLVESL